MLNRSGFKRPDTPIQCIVHRLRRAPSYVLSPLSGHDSKLRGKVTGSFQRDRFQTVTNI